MAWRPVLRTSFNALLASVLLAACGGKTEPTADPCLDVVCTGDTVCAPSTGQCVPSGGGADGGSLPQDAGTHEPDAGASDGGADACGGCSGATPVCDEASGACVRCNAIEGCSGLAPFCDTTVSGGICVQCSNDADCEGRPGAPVCNQVTRLCAACVTDEQCPASAPVCDPGSNLCVRCTENRGCGGNTPVCNTEIPGGFCVGCVDSSQCTTDVSASLCDPSNGTCVGCLNDGQCPAGAPVCDPSVKSCVVCTDDNDCGGSTPLCDTSVPGGRCVQCTGQPGQCGGATPVCDPTTDSCVECLGSGDCSDPARPLCDGNNRCVTCTETSGCSGATPICDTRVPGGACVACLSALDCGGATPVCNPATQRCVQCVDSQQCGSASVCNTTNNTCVGCLGNADCSSAAPYCESATCVQCRSGADCQNPSPICDATACRACAVGTNECGPGNYCPNGSCKSIPDTCATAELITFPAGSDTVTFTADTTLAADDVDGTCNPNARGAELVYRLNLPVAKDITVTAVRAAGSDANPVLFARFGSAACNFPELPAYCADAENGGSETLRIMNRSGDVFLFVESYGATPGAINVTVTLEEATVAPSNDACSTAKLLTFDANGVATERGNTTLASNNNVGADPAPSCSYTAKDDGRDVVYRMVLSSPKDVQITASREGSSTVSPVVYVRKPGACNSPNTVDELGCNSSLNGDQATANLGLRNLAAGEYFIWVDSALQTGGRFRLEVRTSDPLPIPPNDTCAGAQTLTFTGGVAAVTGDTRGAFDSPESPLGSAPTCGNGDGYDVVYSFQLTQPQDVIVEVTPTGASPSLRPTVYLRPLAACESGLTNDELACAAATSVGSPVTQRLSSLGAGSYALWVDSPSGAAGSFQLEVRLETPQPPPSNDVCSGAQALSFSNGVASVIGSTGTATNSQNGVTNTAPSCSSGAGSQGRDVVYSVTPATAAPLSVVVVPDPLASGFRPVVYVRNVCETNQSANQLACQETDTVGHVASVTTGTLTAGQPYSVYVDGARMGGGAFRMDARLGAPPNDTCASARTIAVTTPTQDNRILDSTNLASNDYGTNSPNPFSTPCARTSPGRDLVFRFVAPQSRSYTATLQPDTRFDAVLYRMEGSCAPTSCVEGVDKGLSSGDPEVMTFNGVAGTTYWFVVDGYSSTTPGGFSFKVE